MKTAGVAAASFLTRLSAGWIRCSRSSKESFPSTGTAISPSRTNCCGGQPAKDLDQLGEVPRERLPRLRLELTPNLRRERRGSESRPTWARIASPCRPASPRPTRASIGGNGGAIGKRQKKASSANRPVRERSGCQRSPRRRTRAGTLSIRKSSIEIPFSTSFQVTGTETVARGVGRTE